MVETKELFDQGQLVTTDALRILFQGGAGGLRVDGEAGRVAAELDHDAVRVEVVLRVAPSVIDIHERFDACRLERETGLFLG